MIMLHLLLHCTLMGESSGIYLTSEHLLCSLYKDTYWPPTYQVPSSALNTGESSEHKQIQPLSLELTAWSLS